MQSNGPFKVYDHAEAKGPKEYYNSQNINEQALERFDKEMQELKTLKEFQKDQFHGSNHKAEMLYSMKKNMKDQATADNQDFIMDQMDNRADLKREFEMREKKYYKPHFGPEETDSLIMAEMDRKNKQKIFINSNLQMQMDYEQTRKCKDFIKERSDDLVNLKKANE